VLEVVGEHAHQPHPQGHRRIPGPVHDAAKIGIGELAHVPEGLLVDCVVIPDQQGTRVHLHGGHVLGLVSVAGVLGVERQPEPLHPAPGGPDLLDLKGVGQMIVLDPGQMPDQPADRVRRRVEAKRQLLGREAVDNPVDHLADPAK
jgi:hypothetical protein